jgi:hypothetical protein
MLGKGDLVENMRFEVDMQRDGFETLQNAYPGVVLVVIQQQASYEAESHSIVAGQILLKPEHKIVDRGRGLVPFRQCWRFIRHTNPILNKYTFSQIMAKYLNQLA